MEPTLRPGQLVVGLRASKPRYGSIVFARVGDKDVIKRLVVDDGGAKKLVGDNANGSHHVKLSDTSQIFARLVWPQTKPVDT